MHLNCENNREYLFIFMRSSANPALRRPAPLAVPPLVELCSRQNVRCLAECVLVYLTTANE